MANDCINSHLNPFMNLKDTLKKRYGLWMGFNCFEATEPLRRDNLLFTSKSLGVNGTRLSYLRRMKGQYTSYFYKPFRPLSLSRSFFSVFF